MNYELSSRFRPRPSAKHILFDLDGTISLIRGGWVEVMLKLFLENIPRLPGESEEQLRELLLDDALRLNGKPSVHQMFRFVERMNERGAKPEPPQAYQAEFASRLRQVAQQRRNEVRVGKRPLESVLVAGVLDMLELLKERGKTLFLASGTIADIVIPEVDEFGLRRYFGDRVYAAPKEHSDFSKEHVIEDILKMGVDPENFVSFGDGFVENHVTNRLGGLAVGVASDETAPGSGRMDHPKRDLLMEVGAGVVIADYREPERLYNLIFGSK